MERLWSWWRQWLCLYGEYLVLLSRDGLERGIRTRVLRRLTLLTNILLKESRYLSFRLFLLIAFVAPHDSLGQIKFLLVPVSVDEGIFEGVEVLEGFCIWLEILVRLVVLKFFVLDSLQSSLIVCDQAGQLLK